MWKDYKHALAVYALCGLAELSRRGYDYPHHCDTFKQFLSPKLVLPPFIGEERLHSSHRAALLYKNPDWYGQFGWKEKPAVPDAKGRLPYYWPV